jgi:purine-binding chemotaxis protein CheW
MTMRALVFQAAGLRYALPIEAVREVQRIVAFCPVPGATGGLIGMFDLRGEVVAAIDFGEMVGLGCSERGLDTPMVIMQSGDRRAALVVDEVEDVVEMDDRSMRAVPGLHPLAERALGMFTDDGGLLTVLDPGRLVPGAMLFGGDVASPGAASAAVS